MRLGGSLEKLALSSTGSSSHKLPTSVDKGQFVIGREAIETSCLGARRQFKS